MLDKKINNRKYESLLGTLLVILLAIIVLGLLLTTVYCWLKYGNMAYGDIPNWAHLFMFGKGGGITYEIF